MREKRGKAPVRAPCPELSRGLIFRLRLTIAGSKLVNLTVSLIGNLRQQEQFVAGEAAGRVPFIGIVLVAAFEGVGGLRYRKPERSRSDEQGPRRAPDVGRKDV